MNLHTQLVKTKDVQQMIQDRIEKIQDIKHSAELRKIYSSLCSPTTTRNWPEISIDTTMTTLRRALTQLQDTLNEKLSHSVTELKWMQQYAVDVTLDPDTAHHKLILTDDGKQVTHGDVKQKLPDNPKRFDRYGIVLGKEGFSSGRFYFVVQVKGKTEWNLGVARESTDRKGENTLCPDNGYWTVVLRNGNKYKACASPSVRLSLRVKPQRVGVFVDYEEGLVSFYDVESSSHIYSYTVLFNTIFPSLPNKIQLMKTQKDVQQMIQDRIKKIQGVKHSAEVRKIYSSLCSPTNTRNWPEISMKTHKNLETLRRALTQLQDTLNKKLSHQAIELKWMQQYAGLRNGNEYSGNNVRLSLRVKLQWVGVFVDYEEGLVSFYDVESCSHTYSYTVCIWYFKKKYCIVMIMTQLMKTQKDVQQMIQDRIKKIQDIKLSAKVRKIYTSLCSPTNTKNWSEISMKNDKSMMTLRRALTQLQDTLDEKLSHSVTGLKWMQQYADLKWMQQYAGPP
ncbi:E3 ubiquitin- ligase TRIM39-like isoform X1 [Labeo rohita]|uniref:E3 ubiquitin-ligase TRIM39-like isoform X1 n=1 Tax=Labeo rohita TaxID=84645 RepID=A0A498MJY9_LABRO|nr:E3 ubiquitin- ligase TRIM39-like isoform X1 [Labeo rohita]